MRWPLCKYLGLLSFLYLITGKFRSLDNFYFNCWSSVHFAKSSNPYSCLPLQLPLPLVLSVHRTTHSNHNLHTLNHAIVCFHTWNSPCFLLYWLTPNFLSSYNSNIHYSVKPALTHFTNFSNFFFVPLSYLVKTYTYYPTYDGAFIIE